jgi:hypothetical protein
MYTPYRRRYAVTKSVLPNVPNSSSNNISSRQQREQEQELRMDLSLPPQLQLLQQLQEGNQGRKGLTPQRLLKQEEQQQEKAGQDHQHRPQLGTGPSHHLLEALQTGRGAVHPLKQYRWSLCHRWMHVL